MPETLVESELFGYEKGAFTGALTRKPGSFEVAHSGTIFLDEVGDLPLDAQAKLLRVLQDQQVQRVGATRPVPVNVRVIAATNHDLEHAVSSKQFRPDLFFRLSVFPLKVPPLRDRRDDITLLARHFLRHFAKRLGRDIDDIAPDALQRLTDYRWPGNVRELQNCIERAIIVSRGTSIEAHAVWLPEIHVTEVLEPDVSVQTDSPSSGTGESLTFAEAERQAILDALNLTGWRVSGQGGAADRLGLRPTTLHAKMKKLGIRRPKAFVPPPAPSAGI
jgi:transcriptional regulator with GAF, ATPase, and Fis domain